MGANRDSEYNYVRFRPELMTERFEGGPKPGGAAPDFSTSSLDGHEVRLSDFRDQRHVVLQFGSFT